MLPTYFIKHKQNPGKKIFSWTACNYHPHKRSNLWRIVFGGIIIAIAVVFMLVFDDFFSTLLILGSVCTYVFIHREGHEKHNIDIFTVGILVDNSVFFTWKQFCGYWFVFDESVSIINFELIGGKNKKLSLQMGHINPEEFRKLFMSIDGFIELEYKKESVLDLWIRVLKL